MKQTLRWLGAAIAAVLLVSACGSKSGGSDVIHTAQGFIDRAAACKDLACAKKVEDELTEFAGKHMNDLTKEEAHFVFEEAEARVGKIVEQLTPAAH